VDQVDLRNWKIDEAVNNIRRPKTKHGHVEVSISRLGGKGNFPVAKGESRIAASAPPLVGRWRGGIIGGGGQIDLPAACLGKTADAAATFGTLPGRARLNPFRCLPALCPVNGEVRLRRAKGCWTAIRAGTLLGNSMRSAVP
jgi:hypothetical protein